MPYAADHAAQTRQRIVESARRLFNRKGLTEVSIEEIMQGAGLTRGGFYHHFKTKDELYVEAITHVTRCKLKERPGAGSMDMSAPPDRLMRQLIEAYLSKEHLQEREGHCPLVALPSDVARSSEAVRGAYQEVLLTMAGLFERGLSDTNDPRNRAFALAALCVGGMTLARTVADEPLAQEIRSAVLDVALDLAASETPLLRKVASAR